MITRTITLTLQQTITVNNEKAYAKEVNRIIKDFEKKDWTVNLESEEDEE